ncbi:MAG: hypothetical protein AB1665_05095 [Candidatus Thermoplasmatota archaeon]
MTNALRYIAIPFLVVALISAYGLYQTTDNYVSAASTYLKGGISHLELSFEENGDALFNLTIELQNMGTKLAVKLKTISCRLYTKDFVDTNYLGAGERSYLSSTPPYGTIPPGEKLVIDVEIRVLNGSRYMQRLMDAREGSGYIVSAFGDVKYELVEFPEWDKSIPLFYPPMVVSPHV